MRTSHHATRVESHLHLLKRPHLLRLFLTIFATTVFAATFMFSGSPFGIVLTLASVYLGHLLACVTQCILHRWLGHTAAGGFVFRTHVGSHHTIYTETRMVSAHYSDEELSLTPFLIVPAAMWIILSLWLLPPHLAVATALGLGLSFALQAYLHLQFHKAQSWLCRYRWFLRLRKRHGVHHRHGDANFGLVDFTCDRLCGTFRDAELEQ